jgi:glycosyltransferase involved in cell wall biosynthesis
MLRWTLRAADRAIAVSTALRDRCVELGCLQEKVVTLSNGVDPDLFAVRPREECRKRLGLPEDGEIAVCVGHLNDGKNQSVLIQALAAMVGEGVRTPRLVLVGEGPNRARLESEARRCGVQDCVRFAGRRPHDEIPYWMGAADWLVLSSLYEGWPTVYFEAMACGRPVITSNVSAARDAVCRDDYGLVVEPNTPEAFARALAAAMTRPFDAAAIRAYAEQHSWDNWAQRMLDLVREVLGSRHR